MRERKRGGGEGVVGKIEEGGIRSDGMHSTLMATYYWLNKVSSHLLVIAGLQGQRSSSRPHLPRNRRNTALL